jgi:type I restriction enzyme R subunit
LKPEEKAREKINALLEAAGWKIQQLNELNLGASSGVAVCEFPLSSGAADYLLFVNRRPVGVVEAKSEGTTLSGVAEQSQKYVTSPTKSIPKVQEPLPFAYESTGTETYFRDLRDPRPRSRPVFAFHKPETLLDWLSQESTVRKKLQNMPTLISRGLRDCQIEAIRNLEMSFAEDRPRALIQMASGSGKTYMAVSFIYRLIKFANARRVLFLVDRSNLGIQAKNEFYQYATPDDGRKFTELYNVQHLTSNTIDPVPRVCITTIQRLYSMLMGEKEFDPTLEEQSLFHISPFEEKEKEVSYNPQIPIETFDFIITDECHRSIYHLWRQVLEYFDAFIIGLTATPSKQTMGFFKNNLVTEYNHERAVADRVNVTYEVYRIKTKITEKGSKVDAGFYVDKRDRLTRKLRWEELDEPLEYKPNELDRSVVAPDQIRTIVRTFRDRLSTDIFPGRKEVPKTLIFAKDDSHAEDIVHIVREEFGKGNEFCKKITYKAGEKPEKLITDFRNSYSPRIAVTVDMLSTGTDLRPLECLIFMRDVRSRVFFEQMKGRGTRTIDPTDLRAVTPDAAYKTHFVIIDAVGVCESDKTDSRPLERKRTVPLDKLLMSIALGNRDDDTLISVAGRLSKLAAEIDQKDEKEIEVVAQDKSLQRVVNQLLDALDPDKKTEKAKQIFQIETPTEKQIQEAGEALKKDACAIFDSSEFRNKIIEIRQRDEQIIDTISQDTATFAGFDTQAREKIAHNIIDRFEKFIEEDENELTALQIIYSKPYGQRHLTYEQIKNLAEAIRKPPYNLTLDNIWNAYEQLEESKVKAAGPQRLLTNIVSLLRYAVGQSSTLEPFSETVDKRFHEWLSNQQKTGHTFTPDQLGWLTMIKDHIATSLSIGMDDFEYAPFYGKGGPVKASQLFGQELARILEELNVVLTV